MTRRLHLLGIGGSGMSGIAAVLAERGVDVSGCDRDSGGHDPSHLDAGMEVGYSGAVPSAEPELVEARRLGLVLHHRADLLAEIVAAGEGIAVAGSHGKTTTSGMIAFVLSELGADPTFVVGGSLPQLGVSARSGAGRHVVVEADESDGSLVRLQPRIAVVLNLSHDHHDRYATPGELLELLDGWTRSLAPAAALVVGDGIDLAGPTLRRFGAGEGEGWRTLAATSDAGGARFTLRRPGAPDLAVSLAVPGVHNALNATAALAALDLAGVPPEQAAPVLGRFAGAGRRFETVGIARGVRFVDDYGHHPNEIAATLRVAREQVDAGGRVIACLLPHQPFRVRHLKRELAAATMTADLACVLDVWVARGLPEEGIDGKLVVDEICRFDPGFPVAWTPSFDDAALWLARRSRPGDLIVGMGCGPVYEVGRRLLKHLA
jgi:UDP-N-acetylmuramate--alanine ligase